MATIPYSAFDAKKLKSVGGQTGSVRATIVDKDDNVSNYQYKRSIRESDSVKRKVKASYADTENFGELIAARIAKAFDNKDQERVPEISFVTSDKGKYLGIASKYLGGKDEKPVSLDEYFFPQGLPPGIKHIKLINGPDNPEKGHFNINGEKAKKIKKELAAAIALSALVGDLDINPGNMIVIGDRLGRIDYGHAFKNLMRFANFGGQTTHPNNIIDFFNRATVDGIGASSKSKLWRDYPGLVPSEEMAEALRNLAAQKSSQITAAINEVKQEIIQILKDPKNSNIDKQHAIQSFQRIYEQVSDTKIDSKLKDEDKIGAILQGLEDYSKKNLEQMAYAANVMDLQVQIRGAIENNKDNDLIALKGLYTKLQNNIHGPFSWIKETESNPPFKGDFDQFVAHQRNVVKINNTISKIDDFLKSNPPQHEKLLARDLKAIAINPKKSEQEKIELLDAKLTKIEDNPQPKSSWFSRLIDYISDKIGRAPKPIPIEAAPNLLAQKFCDFKSKLQNTLKENAQPAAEDVEKGNRGPATP